ncbi:MAG: hypothetical protein NUW08_03290, partial [Candidatus Uhrbacteria bacterium]|nr:hypothetical protein [Candidatus Uhrbacteria bacterium]
MTMKEFVYTDRGRGWVYHAHSLVRSGAILVPTKDVELRLPERGSGILAAGTPLVRNQKLARDTRKKRNDDRRTHLVFEEGLHSLERGLIHAQRFECEDAQEMLARSPQMEQIAKDLYVCGQLSFEDHARIQAALATIRETFDEWKRADCKIEVREHIDTANEQQSKAGRYKAMPASAAAFASRRDIQARFREATQIHAAFGTGTLRVRELLNDIWRRIDVVWKLFRASEEDRLPREIAFAMDARTRNESMVRLVSSQLEEQGVELEAVFALPYAPMARATCDAFGRLAWGVREHRRKIVADTVDLIRSSLRRARMLWYLETRLIRVLSFPSTSSSGPAYQPHTIEAFKKHLALAKARVNDMKDVEFDPALRELVRDYLVAAETNARDERYEEARVELKRLTRELRVQPLTSGRRAA